MWDLRFSSNLKDQAISSPTRVLGGGVSAGRGGEAGESEGEI